MIFPLPFWLKCLTQQSLVNRCERGAVPGESDVIEAPRKEEWGFWFRVSCAILSKWTV